MGVDFEEDESKGVFGDLAEEDIQVAVDLREDGDDEQKDEDPDLTRERPTKLVAYFGGRAEEDAAAPRADITAMLDRIMEMNIERRVSVKGSDASFEVSRRLKERPSAANLGLTSDFLDEKKAAQRKPGGVTQELWLPIEGTFREENKALSGAHLDMERDGEEGD